MRVPLSALLTLEGLLNRWLQETTAHSASATQAWQHLAERRIRFEWTSLDASIVAVFAVQGVSLLRGSSEDSADAWLKGSTQAYLSALHSSAPSSLANLMMGGDLTLFSALQTLVQQGRQQNRQQMLARIEAVPLGGKIVTHLEACLQQLEQWTQRTQEHAQRDLSLYLGDEAALFMNQDQLHLAQQDLALLRQDLDRLEARLQRLNTVAAEHQGAN